MHKTLHTSGRRAHGPKVEKDWSRKLNRNERRLARNSALAATTDVAMVSNRGHRFAEEISSLPIILGDYSENGEKIDIEAFNLNGGTRKVNAIFEALGLEMTYFVLATVERLEQERQPCVAEFTRHQRVYYWL